jgi:uncharacterized tellurite resistance protein B-like protein
MNNGKFDFSESIRKSLKFFGEDTKMDGKEKDSNTNIDEPKEGSQPSPKKVLSSTAPLHELEYALTVLLVELASSDENFDQEEYHTIMLSLQRIFNTDRSKVKEYVNRATVSISQVRGTTAYARLLRDNLSLEDRKIITDIISELISSDGKHDPFEVYHQNRIKHILLPEELVKED